MIDELAIERFWSKVDKRGPDDCWLWVGTVAKTGYGRFIFNKKLYHAHRTSLEIDGQHNPGGLWALHSCDKPSCVNPAHLRWGTPKENMDDMSRRGRRVLRQCKILTPELRQQVLAMDDYARVIAERLGLTEGYVSKIRRMAGVRAPSTGLWKKA